MSRAPTASYTTDSTARTTSTRSRRPTPWLTARGGIAARCDSAVRLSTPHRPKSQNRQSLAGATSRLRARSRPCMTAGPSTEGQAVVTTLQIGQRVVLFRRRSGDQANFSDESRRALDSGIAQAPVSSGRAMKSRWRCVRAKIRKQRTVFRCLVGSSRKLTDAIRRGLEMEATSTMPRSPIRHAVAGEPADPHPGCASPSGRSTRG